ncbi:MAG TPA: H-X9-DG-CTERM domain-containing protein [Abditibacterium sp.]|jgi:prepilin-type processing-associated H-X9-DG protein/prepilin-type N-terminal cleavage/methylation domain-containing protein
MRKSTARRAFTLVEILVVLAIIALLSALLLTVFNRVRENGRGTVCLSNQKQILLALQLYQEDSAGRFPLRNPFDIHVPLWLDTLLPYVKEPSLFICPSDADIETTKLHGFVNFAEVGRQPTISASYLVSEELLWRRRRIGKKEIVYPRLLSEVIHPASTIFLSDGVKQAFPRPPYWTNNGTSEKLVRGMAGLGYILRDPTGTHDDGSYNEGYAPNPRHNGRVNVGFVDGHVKSMNVSQWYFPDTPYLDPARGG